MWHLPMVTPRRSGIIYSINFKSLSRERCRISDRRLPSDTVGSAPVEPGGPQRTEDQALDAIEAHKEKRIEGCGEYKLTRLDGV